MSYPPATSLSLPSRVLSFALVVYLLGGVGLTIAGEVDFSHEIVPLLRENCAKCHTGQKKEGRLSLNTRESLLAGGELGAVVVVGKSERSELIKRVMSDDPDERMPPKGPRLSATDIGRLKAWIDAGLPWETGFSFAPKVYEPPLRPRRPELPAAVDGRDNPVERIVDAYLAQHRLPRPKPIDDATFARRVYLDIIGLLPKPEELQEFLDDERPNKRTLLIESLLARNVDYTEHWLTFWNDLLRNDYAGTGYIDGGRRQITRWLYDALLSDKPYDQFVRELLAPPTEESRGFIDGIRWRGEVSAGQTVEIQFAQSVGQTFLGINLKCASCHDSFIDRWKLADSYGLAAVYSSHPLELYRCDKPTGKMAAAAWLFPEIGQVDAKADRTERLKQLAALLVHPQHGRFTRTIVNRIWQRLMGRGIVHPANAMQTEPWNADLLDYLAVDLADHRYDLKQTIRLIATSAAYQSQSQIVAPGSDDAGYIYRGPRAKRLTAEEFVDAVWQITDTAPTHFDAPVIRGQSEPGATTELGSHWVWTMADPSQVPAGETITFHKTLELKQSPLQAAGVITCDNSYVLYVNGRKVQAGDNWELPDAVLLTGALKKGMNELLIVAKNGGSGPNPAGLFFEARLVYPGADAHKPRVEPLLLDDTWQWTRSQPGAQGKFKTAPTDWKPAVVVANPQAWMDRVGGKLSTLLAAAGGATARPVRASLCKSDLLMRSLGRPNRDQIVSVRPEELTTLEAIDLSNGPALEGLLAQGANKIVAKHGSSPDGFVRWLYRFALSRDPRPDEMLALHEALGPKLTEQGVQDIIWSVLMLPEFQMVR